MGPKIFRSQRGKPKLAVGGYVYRISNKNLTSVNWRCERKTCRGSASTPCDFEDPNLLVSTLQVHNHVPDPETVEVQLARNQINEEAVSSQLPPRRIISETMAGMSNGALARLAKRDTLRKQVQRKRRKALGGPQLLPASRGFQVPQEYRLVKEGNAEVQFLLRDTLPDDDELEDEGDANEYEEELQRRLLIFGTNAMVNVLKNATEWMMDATFKVVPSLFYQLLIIHAIFNGHVFPVLYILMPNKQEDTYNRALNMVKNIVGVNQSPQLVVADLELGLHNAILQTWPDVELQGCYFHLTQAIWRKVQELGLATAYINREDVRDMTKALAALAFLLPEQVADEFDNLKDLALDEVYELYSYFELNYVGRKPARGPRRRPRFQISMWNVRRRTQQGVPRTNNKIEAFHYAVQAMFDGVHPNIWKCLRGLQREHAYQYGLYMQALAGEEPPPQKKIYREMNKRLRNLIERHETGAVTAGEFLRGVAYNVNLNV